MTETVTVIPTVGDIFIDKDPHRGPRPLHVIMVVKGPEHYVKKDTAVCLVRGKVTMVSLNRLCDKSRFDRSYPLETRTA